jgi:MFS family permease
LKTQSGKEPSAAAGPSADGRVRDSAAAARAVSELGASPYTRNFWLVFAATFAVNLSINLFVLLPLFVMRLGGDAGMIGAVVGTGALAALVVRPLSGAGIDRWGHQWMAVRFLFLDALATALYIPVGALGWPLFAVRAVHGAIDGTARVALFAMVYELLPAGRRGEGMATFTLCGMIPAAISPLLGEEIVSFFGFGAFFAVAALLCVISALIAIWAPPDRASGHHPQLRPAADAGFRAMLLDRALLPLWIVTLLFSIAVSSRTSFVAPFAYQVNVDRVGWYFMIYCGAAIVVRLFGAGFLDRVGLERMLAPALAAFAVGVAMLAWTGRFGMLEMAAVMGGVGHGYFYPSVSALVIGHTRPAAMGRSSAIFNSLLDFGAMIGPYLLGLVATAAGYGPMFLIAGAIALMGAVIYAAAEPAARRGRPAP